MADGGSENDLDAWHHFSYMAARPKAVGVLTCCLQANLKSSFESEMGFLPGHVVGSPQKPWLREHRRESILHLWTYALGNHFQVFKNQTAIQSAIHPFVICALWLPSTVLMLLYNWGKGTNQAPANHEAGKLRRTRVVVQVL